MVGIVICWTAYSQNFRSLSNILLHLTRKGSDCPPPTRSFRGLKYVAPNRAILEMFNKFPPQPKALYEIPPPLCSFRGLKYVAPNRVKPFTYISLYATPVRNFWCPSQLQESWYE